MEEINVGYKFKQIRENAGLTLKQVSAMSDCLSVLSVKSSGAWSIRPGPP